MEESMSKALDDFDGQVITDHFQSLVNLNKIYSFDSFQYKKKKPFKKYHWQLVIKKRWKYDCVVEIHSKDTEYFNPKITSSSRFCKIKVHQSEKLSVLKIHILKEFALVCRGVEAEKYVMSVINNKIDLNNDISVHCFPSSATDDMKGIDFYLYVRMSPKSDVIKIPIQVKCALPDSKYVNKHLRDFPHVPIIFYKRNVYHIKQRILEIIDEQIVQNRVSKPVH
jgi:hypothetical protein